MKFYQSCYHSLVILVLFAFSSCEDEPELINFNYSFQSGLSSEFDSLEFLFEYTRAYGLTENNDTTIISVYLEPVQLTFDLKESNQLIPLGSSAMYAAEYEQIIGYNFGIGQATLYRGTESVALKEAEYYERIFTETILRAKAGQVYDVIFKLDADQSLVPIPDGGYKFLPRIQTTIANH